MSLLSRVACVCVFPSWLRGKSQCPLSCSVMSQKTETCCAKDSQMRRELRCSSLKRTIDDKKCCAYLRTRDKCSSIRLFTGSHTFMNDMKDIQTIDATFHLLNLWSQLHYEPTLSQYERRVNMNHRIKHFSTSLSCNAVEIIMRSLFWTRF